LPKTGLTFYEGFLADSVRANPHGVFVCTALDGVLVDCQPVVPAGIDGKDGDGARPVQELTPTGGLGGANSGVHLLEVWLSADSSGHASKNLNPANASVAFSSADAGALHMPDDLDTNFAECWHDRLQDGDYGENPTRQQGRLGTGEVAAAAAVGRSLPRAKGILHIGANVANEAKGYARCVGGNGANVLFVECDEAVSEVCAENARKFGQRCVHACLADSNRADVSFFQSDGNGGMSSSLRRFEQHMEIFPGVEHSGKTAVRTWRGDDLFASHTGLLPDMNVVLLDAQGMEFEILTGMPETLKDFDVAVVEVSHVPVYKGQHLGPDVDSLMAQYGFECRAHCDACPHCDRLYVRPSSAVGSS